MHRREALEEPNFSFIENLIFEIFQIDVDHNWKDWEIWKSGTTGKNNLLAYRKTKICPKHQGSRVLGIFPMVPFWKIVKRAAYFGGRGSYYFCLVSR